MLPLGPYKRPHHPRGSILWFDVGEGDTKKIPCWVEVTLPPTTVLMLFCHSRIRCSSSREISNNNSKKAQNSSSRLPGGVPFATGNHAVKGRSFPDRHHTKPCLFYSTLLVFYCHSRRASKAQRPSFLNCWWLLLPRPALKCALV